MKIAMWSGPRNLSTALMYSFGNRADFIAWDEPFYAPYLAKTGLDHPMAADIIDAHETDPMKVAQCCNEPNIGDTPHFYMKHMPHHMINGFPLNWTKDCVNVHLIRHPARVIASYTNKRETVTAKDIGFEQQLELYQKIGGLVIDSADIRNDPEEMLSLLCDIIGLDFDPAMLNWPAGPKSFDGVWSSHWYDSVHASTGFAGQENALPNLDDHGATLASDAIAAYETMAADKI